MKVTADEIRPAAVAGKFYPAQPFQLENMVEQFLDLAQSSSTANTKAVITTHAGYIYSGPVAGSAFRPWSESASTIRRIVLLGPSHFVDFPGIALPRASAFAT